MGQELPDLPRKVLQAIPTLHSPARRVINQQKTDMQRMRLEMERPLAVSTSLTSIQGSLKDILPI